jgi:hypothetical protein
MSTIVGLATVNVLTSPQHMWFVYPGGFIFLGVLSQAGRLWAGGVPLSQLFTRGKLHLEDWISAKLKLSEINEDFANMKAGKTLRSVIMFDA